MSSFKFFRSLVFVFFLVLLLTFVSSGELQVTQEHPFLINGEWIPASDLQVGDLMQTVDGRQVRITKITDVEVPEEEAFPVYNLEAGIYHNFVVCGEENCDEDSVGVVVKNSNVAEPFARNPFINKHMREAVRKSTNIFTDSDGTQWIELNHYFLPDQIPAGQTKTLEVLMKESGGVMGSQPTSALALFRGEKRLWGSVLKEEYIPREVLAGWLSGGKSSTGGNIFVTGTFLDNTRVGQIVYRMKYSDYQKLYSLTHVNPVTSLKLHGPQYGSGYLSLRQGPLNLREVYVNYNLPISSFGTAQEASTIAQLATLPVNLFSLSTATAKTTGASALISHAGIRLFHLVKNEEELEE